MGPTMSIRISNLRLGLDEPESALPARLARVLKVPPGDLCHWRILRKSLDARVKDALLFVYTAEVSLAQDEDRIASLARQTSQPVRIEMHEEPAFRMPPSGQPGLAHRPVVVGSGPAGFVGGYFLAEQGYRPLVPEGRQTG